MGIFKEAKEVFIPDTMLDTTKWVTDKELKKIINKLRRLKSQKEAHTMIFKMPCDKELDEMLDNLPKSTLEKLANRYNEDAVKEQKRAPKRKTKLYLAVQQWSDSDGWEPGEGGANILYATLSKDKMDAYVADLNKDWRNKVECDLVTIDLDTDYIDKVDKGTKTQVASWFDQGFVSDDPFDI